MDMDKVISENRWVPPTPANPCVSLPPRVQNRNSSPKISPDAVMVTASTKLGADGKPMKSMGSLTGLIAFKSGSCPTHP